MLGFTWKQYVYALIGAIIAIGILQFWIVPVKNAKICEDFFSNTFDVMEDNLGRCSEAHRYDSRAHICYCEDGDYYLDSAMIEEENKLRRERYEVNLNKTIAEHYSNINTDMDFIFNIMNISDVKV